MEPNFSKEERKAMADTLRMLRAYRRLILSERLNSEWLLLDNTET